VPDISTFQVSGPTANPSAGPDLSQLVPQTSTNYQLGTVYHAGNWSADFDIYKIDFKNRISTFTGSASTPGCQTGETCYFNQGGVTFQGIEGQLTYAFTPAVTGFVNGSINDAKDNATHQQVSKAPKNTFGVGLMYKQGPLAASIIDKYTGEQWTSDALNPSPGVYTPFALTHIPGYHQTDVSAEYSWDRYRLQVQIQNIFDSHAVADMKASLKTGAASPYDQYFWQAPRNVQASFKVAF
jgi:iron complex outermembrane receptor protein